MMRASRREIVGMWSTRVAVCLLVLVLLSAVCGAGSHTVGWVPYLLVPVFLFAMVVAVERIWVEFVEGFALPRCVSRSCLFQRPPPAALL